jgi:hypothetical protein
MGNLRLKCWVFEDLHSQLFPGLAWWFPKNMEYWEPHSGKCLECSVFLLHGQITRDNIYLLRKAVYVFFLSHWYLPKQGEPTMLLLPLGSPWWVGVHWGGLVVFRAMVQELLNTEQFCQRKFNKIKTKMFEGNWGKLLVLLENPWWVGFLGGDFVMFRPLRSDIEFWVIFVTGN